MRVCIVNKNYLELAVDQGPVDHNNYNKKQLLFYGFKKIDVFQDKKYLPGLRKLTEHS